MDHTAIWNTDMRVLHKKLDTVYYFPCSTSVVESKSTVLWDTLNQYVTWSTISERYPKKHSFEIVWEHWALLNKKKQPSNICECLTLGCLSHKYILFFVKVWHTVSMLSTSWLSVCHLPQLFVIVIALKKHTVPNLTYSWRYGRHIGIKLKHFISGLTLSCFVIRGQTVWNYFEVSPDIQSWNYTTQNSPSFFILKDSLQNTALWLILRGWIWLYVF